MYISELSGILFLILTFLYIFFQSRLDEVGSAWNERDEIKLTV